MNFKRIIALLLLLASLFSLAACTGEYVGPSNGGGGGGGGNGGEGDFVPPVMNDDPTDDFTVTLYADGQPYSPRMEMLAYWTDGYSVFAAKFDKSGVARIDGLDGDYRVTLSAVPNEYTYDPNSNIATNDERNITLNLHTLNMLTGTGTNSYSGHSISKTGVYSATLKGPDEGIYFMYSPTENGIYTIESWVDTTADNVNPYVDVYVGTFAWNAYQRTIDDGGTVGSYTTNFKHDVRLTQDQVGNNYIFAVKADSRTGKYPVTVTFSIKRDGEFEYPSEQAGAFGGLAVPKDDLRDFNKADHEYGDGYVIKNPEYLLEGTSGTYVFDERRFKLWEKDDGGDGFYHVYDAEKYSETDGYGPILYAYITENSRFIERPFSLIEYKGNTNESLNAALTAGGYNYKVLIEGMPQLAVLGSVNDGGYFCVSDCPCHEEEGADGDYVCIAKRDGDGILIACKECDKDCRPCPPEFFDYVTVYSGGTMITNPDELSLNVYGGVAKTLVYKGVSYLLTLDEREEGETALIAGEYTARAEGVSFKVEITEDGISIRHPDRDEESYTYKLGFLGYQHYANSDGLVPVTGQLRDFLYAYCVKETFFYDGTGRLETGYGYQAVGESGWLFACAYYEER